MDSLNGLNPVPAVDQYGRPTTAPEAIADLDTIGWVARLNAGEGIDSGDLEELAVYEPRLHSLVERGLVTTAHFDTAELTSAGTVAFHDWSAAVNETEGNPGRDLRHPRATGAWSRNDFDEALLDRATTITHPPQLRVVRPPVERQVHFDPSAARSSAPWPRPGGSTSRSASRPTI